MTKTSSFPTAQPGAPSVEHRVRIINKGEAKEAAETLAEAFWDDDVAQYFVRTKKTEKWSEEERRSLHKSIMRAIVVAHCMKGLVLTVGPDYGCVALWMPPGKNMDDRLTAFRSGLWGLKFHFCKEGKRRFRKEFLPLLHRTKSEVLGDQDNNSWYLVYIGTKPTAQGKGYARMLIEYVTKQADAQSLVCYLESSNDVNPTIYRKFGFQTVKKIQLMRGPVPVDLDIMVRQPDMKDASPPKTDLEHHGQTAETA
ncbi:MAG: hypothetical protein Q9219_005221 [cf. Caloplaca sp. 3 TL-2023]